MEVYCCLAPCYVMAPIQPALLAELLDLLRRGGDQRAFLEAYHRFRPFGSKPALRAADEHLAEMARQAGPGKTRTAGVCWA